MSVHVMARVWKQSRQTGTKLLMLLAIADHVNEHGTAYPGVESLAKKCRISKRHANNILAELRRSGELRVRENAGPKGTNLYQVCLPGEGLNSGSSLNAASTLPLAARNPEGNSPRPLNEASGESSLNHQESSKDKSIDLPDASPSSATPHTNSTQSVEEKMKIQAMLKAASQRVRSFRLHANALRGPGGGID